MGIVVMEPSPKLTEHKQTLIYHKIVQTEGQNLNLKDLIIYHYFIQENLDSIKKNMEEFTSGTSESSHFTTF